MALEENTNTGQQSAQNLPTRSKLTPEPISTNAQKMAGTPKTGANPKPAGMSYVDQKVARLNGMMLDLYKPDENKYNKLTTYNSSHYGQNFERYYAHGKFKQLGFSPFRNNEEFYNNNSSLWNDAARGGRTALRLAGLGASSTFTNWGSFLSDKPNTEEAEDMERLMSIGSSSREGFGAKAINFGVNAGYTYGVMAEILAEEVALFFAGTVGALPTGGAATVGAIARTGTNVGRAFRALKMLTKVDDARQAWKIAKTAAGGVREFLPLSQTTSLLTKTGKAAAKWDSLDNMAKTSKAFGTFYRDLREINAVTSEAKMEGGTAQNNVANQLMAKFRKDNGREPNLAEAQSIAAQATKAGYLSSQANIAGIYVSNKIVLDKALKGIPGLKNLEKAAGKSKATFIFNKDWKKMGVDPHSMLKGASKYTKRAYYKHVFNPKNLGKGGLNYLSANLMEGTQEVYQEAVGKGITDYFVNTYNNPNLAGSGYFRTMMESGLKSQASNQGLETFLSGFLMAGPMTMTQSAFYKGYDAVRMKKLKNQAQKFSADPSNAGKENPYQAQIDRELEFDQKTLEAMNEVTKDPIAYFNALEKDLKIQRDLAIAGEQAALDGDGKFARDTRDASLVSHSIQLLNAGRFDIFQDQLKGLRNLSKEELQEAFGEDPAAEKGTVQERLEKVIARTNEIRDVYEEYENTINPHSLKDEPEDYLAFEQMRSVMISNDIHFKFVAGRMESIYNDFTNSLPFKNANVTDFAPLFSIGMPSSEAPILRPGMLAEVEMLTKEIEALGDRPENAAKKEQLTKKKQSLESLSGLSRLYLGQYLTTQKVSQNEESFAENSKVLEETEALFKDSFFNHIKLLAEQNGQVVLDKDIEKTYQAYRDYWKLFGDRAEYANAINAFANPQQFAQMKGRVANAMKAAMAVRKEKLKESLATYKKKYLTNNFLNDLFEKFNAFVDPDEAQAFLDDNEIPVTFYSADTLEKIELGSEEYKGIMALVDEYDEAYFEETGKRYIKQVEGNLQSFRDKLKDDKRTVNELGKEFGFDPTSQTTQVDARQVLQAVINSKFAEKDLKKLAQILSGMVPVGTQVTFKMDHHTNSTFDDQNGIIVDPRFSSEGYNIGVVPIEFSIMNAMMQKIVSESLQTDSAFANAITNLRAKLEADTKDPVEKTLLSLALASNEGFVAEVMTSPLLQQKLESLPFTDNLTEQTEESKTLWDTFINEIKTLLRRLFGNKRAPSVYDEAVIVITNKLSQPGVAPNLTAEETEVTEEVTTEEEPALEELLKEGFQQALSELDPSERLGMNYESWKLTSPLAADIRKKYQAEKVKQTVAKQGAAAVPALTEEERKRVITDLGYTVAEMNNMGEAEVEEIIKEKRKKKITLRRKSGDVEIEFDEFLPAEAVVENAIKDLKIKLEKAGFKVFELKDDKGKVIDSWYAKADVYGNEIPGTRHERVSNVVKDKGDFAPGAADRGTVIDELLRDYLSNEITNIVDFKTRYNSLRQQYPSAIFSDAMLNELFDSFRTVQRQIKSLGLRVDARIPTLYGVLGPKIGTDGKPVNVAGSIDVLAFNSLGEVFIIDLKTSTQDRRLQYKAEEALENMFGAEWPEVKDAINKSENNIDTVIDGKRVSPEQLEKLKEFRNNPQFQELDGKYGFKVYFYKSDDEAQQNAYRELLKQVFGIDVKNIVIFPLKVTKTGKTFTSVKFQIDGKGKYTMYVKGPGSTDIYDITGRENIIIEYPENPISEERLNELTGAGPVTETPAQSEIETKKADIERRRQEELGVMEKRTYTEDDGTTFEVQIHTTGDKKIVKVTNLDTKGSYTNEYSKDLSNDKIYEVINPNKFEYSEVQEVQSRGGKKTDAINAKYDAELAALEGTETTEEQPTEETNEQVVADLRAREQAELLYAIPNIESYKDANGKLDKSKLSPLESQLYKQIYDKYDKLISPLLGTQPKAAQAPNIVTVYHHTSVAPQNFDFGNFQRGKDQISQFGDGLNASSTTTPFLVKRYGEPIAGEIDESKFIVIDANKSEKELYEELKAKGYKFNNPANGSYIKNDPNAEYDSADKANVNPAIISLFNDFQKSNPEVKGVKVINHIIGIEKVDPFYVIYDAKSFYGPGSLSKTQTQPVEETTEQGETGTQTQMEFEDLTLNVGDTVKVNTLKDGEGVIKEDRGDKVLLEDGRQIMKKNLTKLTSTTTEAPKSIVTPELQGKIIYVSPSKDSTTKLFDMPGVVYGNVIYAKVVAGEFSDELVEKLRELAESDITDEFSSAAETIVNVIDNGLTPDKVKAFNYSISVIRTAKGNRVPVGLSSTLRYVMTNLVWTKTMAQARELAKQGLTVVFDNNEAASSNQVDIAFVSDTTDLIDDYTETGKDNYKNAVAGIGRSKVIPTPSGKGILDILQGKATTGPQVSSAMLDLKNSIFIANKSELEAINTELKGLRSRGLLDPILQQQNLTADQVREALAKRKELLKDVLEINEISVGDIVQVNLTVSRFPGMVIAKTEDGITVAKIILNENGGPTQSKDDLFNSKEISTFTAKQIPNIISPMAKEVTPVTPDPDVKAQSDAANNEVKSTPTEVSQRLKDNMENTKNQSVDDTVNEFLEGLCTGKKGKKQ